MRARELERKAIELHRQLCLMPRKGKAAVLTDFWLAVRTAILIIFNWGDTDICDRCLGCDNPLATGDAARFKRELRRRGVVK